MANLIEQLRIAFLYSTSPYSIHITEDSHDETAGDSDGIASEDQSSKHDDLGGNSSIDQSSKHDCLRCPFPSYNREEIYTKKPNILRHYQIRRVLPFTLMLYTANIKLTRLKILNAMRNVLSVESLLIIFANWLSISKIVRLRRIKISKGFPLIWCNTWPYGKRMNCVS